MRRHTCSSRGEAFAIEIFITDGQGFIKASRDVTIYAMKRKLVPMRDPKLRILCDDILRRRRWLPFSERYVIEHLGYTKLDFFNLRRSGNLTEYPVLVEVPGSKIAQFEDVIYVDENEVILTTQPTKRLKTAGA